MRNIETIKKSYASICDYINRCESANEEAGYQAWDTDFWYEKKAELEQLMNESDENTLVSTGVTRNVLCGKRGYKRVVYRTADGIEVVKINGAVYALSSIPNGCISNRVKYFYTTHDLEFVRWARKNVQQ